MSADAGVISEVIDASGDGINPLLGPSGVTVSHADRVYVSGQGSDTVHMVSPDGSVQLVIDAAGDGTAPLGAPSSVAVDLSGAVTVSGQITDNIFRVWGSQTAEALDANGDGVTAFSAPRKIAVDGSGNIYAVGKLSNSVYRISPAHHHATLLMDGSGDGVNPLSVPSAIAVDPQSRVYVTGLASNNAFRIDTDGTVTQILDASGDGINPLSGPVAITVDRMGRVYVAGFDSSNVFRRDKDGAVSEIIGAGGDGSNPLTGAVDVEVDSLDRVYVSGQISSNLFRVDQDGSIALILDSSGDGTSGLDVPSDVALSLNGDVYVAGRASNNVMRVQPEVRLSLSSDAPSQRAGTPLAFALALENTSTAAQTFELSVFLVLPDASELMLVSGVALTLPAGAAPAINFDVPLPGSAPTGMYAVVAKAQRSGEPPIHVTHLEVPLVTASHPTFTDVTAVAGVDFTQVPMKVFPDCLKPFVPGMPDENFTCMQEYLSGSAAAGDYDNDGWTDLYVTRPYEAGILYRNLGDGTFSDVTTAAGLDSVPGANGVAWVDVDNDGDQDLYVASLGDTRNHLLINQGTGQFVEDAVARGAAVETPYLHFGMGIALGDVDADGWIDIYVAEWLSEHDIAAGASSHARLLRNLGPASPGRFEDATVAAGLDLDDHPSPVEGTVPPVLVGFAPALVDLDGDGFTDFALTADFGTSRLFWNDGAGGFTEGTLASGVSTSVAEMGSTFADYDKDGDLDWFVAAITCMSFPSVGDCSGNRLYRNEGNRLFSDQTEAAGVRVGHWGWGAVFFDYDNDGEVDIVHTNGLKPMSGAASQAAAAAGDPSSDPLRLFLNRGAGTFMQVSEVVGLTDTGPGKGLLTFDYDNDGDLDVFVMNTGGPPRLYRNDGGNTDDWLRLEVEGSQSNRDGIGARITVTPVAGGPSRLWEVNNQSYFIGQSERTAHFGLGNGTEPVAEVRVFWPVSGVEQVFQNVARNSTLVVSEPSP